MKPRSAVNQRRTRELLARGVPPRAEQSTGRSLEWEQPRTWERNAPELHTWLRRYAGQSTVRLEQATSELEAAIESGSGFDNPDVLEYAYLCLRADQRVEFGPVTTPFDDDPPEEAKSMTENGRRHWRIKDICEQYDVSRVTLDNWRKLDGFPVPIIDSPPVWDADEIEEWRAGQLEAARERRQEALEIAATGDLDKAAAAAGVSTRTIRRWQAAREEAE